MKNVQGFYIFLVTNSNSNLLEFVTQSLSYSLWQGPPNQYKGLHPFAFRGFWAC